MNFKFSIVSSAQRRTVLLSSVCLAANLFGCSSPSQPSVSPQAEKVAVTDALLQEAVFAKALGKTQEPEKPCSDFDANETIYLSLKFKGRPPTGITTAKFYCENDFITEAKVDFADVNSGVLFSVGECTYVGFSLKHDQPFPVSDKYRAETFLDGKPIGTYKFNVVAPAKQASDAAQLPKT